ncbi:hypothetical protein MIR68_008431 [Amoeboaphelidium protococcarum]|nr:hypothetical protein MIR68_008431 [Amoeboaphelidium protococcarum]
MLAINLQPFNPVAISVEVAFVVVALALAVGQHYRAVETKTQIQRLMALSATGTLLCAVIKLSKEFIIQPSGDNGLYYALWTAGEILYTINVIMYETIVILRLKSFTWLYHSSNLVSTGLWMPLIALGGLYIGIVSSLYSYQIFPTIYFTTRIYWVVFYCYIGLLDTASGLISLKIVLDIKKDTLGSKQDKKKASEYLKKSVIPLVIKTLIIVVVELMCGVSACFFAWPAGQLMSDDLVADQSMALSLHSRIAIVDLCLMFCTFWSHAFFSVLMQLVTLRPDGTQPQRKTQQKSKAKSKAKNATTDDSESTPDDIAASVMKTGAYFDQISILPVAKVAPNQLQDTEMTVDGDAKQNLHRDTIDEIV